MVSHPRAPLGARDLRPLNAPNTIQVQVDELGQPLAVRRRGWPRPSRVASGQDPWRIDDEWWRERPVARLYYALLLEDESLLVVYHDLVADRWFAQRS